VNRRQCAIDRHIWVQPPRLFTGTGRLRGEWLVWECRHCGTARVRSIEEDLERFLATLFGASERDGA
jgi:hypothetical protein